MLKAARRPLSRRLLVLALPVFLAGCVGDGLSPSSLAMPAQQGDYHMMYAAIRDEPYPVPAINLNQVGPEFLRQEVAYDSDEAPGTVIVDPAAHHLYYIEGNGLAMRYGVGVGREGFGWTGTANIKNKQEWPKWFPPSDMQLRDPRAAAFKNGMPGGPSNPLGARAMYLWQGNHDTLYRIHGTNEPASIGKSMSSGCIRMLNQDVIDLYNRVQPGAKVVVLPSDGATSYAGGQPLDNSEEAVPDSVL